MIYQVNTTMDFLPHASSLVWALLHNKWIHNKHLRHGNIIRCTKTWSLIRKIWPIWILFYWVSENLQTDHRNSSNQWRMACYARKSNQKTIWTGSWNWYSYYIQEECILNVRTVWFQQVLSESGGLVDIQRSSEIVSAKMDVHNRLQK